jgi:hypothetical protein
MKRRFIPWSVLILALGWGFASAARAADGVPRAEMPERVYTLLRGAIESFTQREGQEKDWRQRNLQSLEHLRAIAWPDLSKLERVRLFSAKDPAKYAQVWRLAGEEGDQLTLLMPDLTERKLPRTTFSKVEAVDYGGELKALVKLLKARDSESKRPWDFTYIQDFGAGGLPYHGGVFLLHHAYAAAFFGKADEATAIVHEALQQRGLSFEHVYNEGAWQAFLTGITMLEAGGERTKILAQWESALKDYGQSRYRAQLEEYVAALKAQAGEDKQLAATAVADPEKLPVSERVAYYIARIPDVQGAQFSQPGHCMTVGMGEGTKISDAIVKIGRPAVPALIEHLTDTRLTRSVGYWRIFSPSRIVLRAQDVSVQCIERIFDTPLYSPSSTSSYLSNEKPEIRDRVIANIKSWWAENKDQSQVQIYKGQLEKGGTQRLWILQKIEKRDPKAVDGIAYLKQWAMAKPDREGGDLVAILAELEKRDEAEWVRNVALPKMREDHRVILRKWWPERESRVDAPSGSVWFLMQFGDAQDFRFLRSTVKSDSFAGKPDGQSSNVSDAVKGGIESVQSPAAVPLLVDLLGQRQITGSRWISQAEGSMGFGTADKSMGMLVRLTGHDEGYQPGDPDAKRFAAMDRWMEWWKREGEAAFLKQHPSARETMAEAPSLREVDAGRLPPLVSVRDADDSAPITYDVPREGINALIESQQIDARHHGQTPYETSRTDFRFVSRAAAMRWFAAAKPVTPAGASSPLLPAMRVHVTQNARPDSLGRMWCTWQGGGSPVAVFDGKDWRTYQGVWEGNNYFDTGFASVMPGVEGSMIFTGSYSHRFYLFDKDGWVTEPSAPQLAVKYFERVRRALSDPPLPSCNQSHHMVKDAGGNIWWSYWFHEWGVVSAGQPLDGKHSEVKLGPSSRQVFSVLQPIGDGHQMLGVDEAPAAAIIAMKDERVTKLADISVVVHSRLKQFSWRHNALRDSQGRLWIISGQESVALSKDGARALTCRGMLLMEDSKRHLWFVEDSGASTTLVRVAPDQQEARLLESKRIPSFIEAPDGTFWALTDEGLIHFAVQTDPDKPVQLSVIEKHPMHVTSFAEIWCDADGCVWLFEQSGSRKTFLIRFATSTQG